MDSDKFSQHLYKSFRATRGDTLSVIGISLAVIAYFVVPNEAILPLRYAIIPILIGIFLIFWFFHTAWTIYNSRTIVIPSVKYATSAPKGFPSAIILLLLEPSILYSYDSVVAIYFVENEFERLIGVGRVLNVQEDKKIQVIVTHDIDFGDDWSTLLNNNPGTLHKLRIKPTVPSFIMEKYRNE